jgi:hypothetical protein
MHTCDKPLNGIGTANFMTLSADTTAAAGNGFITLTPSGAVNERGLNCGDFTRHPHATGSGGDACTYSTVAFEALVGLLRCRSRSITHIGLSGPRFFESDRTSYFPSQNDAF